MTDDDEMLVGQLQGAVVEQAEQCAFIPTTSGDIAHVKRKAIGEGKHQHQGMLSHARRAVGGDVTHLNAVISSSFHVDIVGTRRQYADQFKVGQGREQVAVQYHLVGDGDIRIVETLLPFIDSGMRMDLEVIDRRVQR